MCFYLTFTLSSSVHLLRGPPPPHFLLPSSCLLFFNNSTNSVNVTQTHMGVEPSTGAWPTYQGPRGSISLKKTSSPSPSSPQLSRAPQLGVGCHDPSLLRVGMVSLWLCCAIQETLPSLTSGPYNHFSSFSLFHEPWEKRLWYRCPFVARAPQRPLLFAVWSVVSCLCS